MDEQTIFEIAEILSEWGFWQLLAITMIILLTAILKIPIKRAAIKYQEQTGIDKSVITWVISILPFIFAFGVSLVLELWSLNWNPDNIKWAEVIKQTSMLGTASMGAFELVKKYAQAATAKDTAKKVAEAKAEAAETAGQGTQKVIPILGEAPTEPQSKKRGKNNVVKL